MAKTIVKGHPDFTLNEDGSLNVPGGITLGGNVVLSASKTVDGVDVSALDSAVVKKALFDANTFLYATDDDTPEAKTRAEVIALLSGQAGGAFDWNSQNLTSLGTLNTHTIPGGTDTICLIGATQELDNKTLDSSVAKGTWTASGTWIIPAVTLGGAVSGGNQNLNNIGHIGLGNNASLTSMVVYVEKAFPAITDNATYRGYYSNIECYKTSAAFLGNIAGFSLNATLGNLNTQDWTNAVGVRGVDIWVGTESGTAAERTLTGMAGLYVDMYVEEAANDILVTNYYGLYVKATSLVGNSKLTNDYGIYIGAQAGGATLNYAIYTAGGSVYHAGDLTAANIITAGNVDGVDVSALDAAVVKKALFDAQTILAATTDDTPAALTVGEQTLVGRITSGNIAALTTTQVRTLLNVADGADVTANNAPQAHDLAGASHNADTLANLNTKVNDATLLGQGTILAFAIAL